MSTLDGSSAQGSQGNSNPGTGSSSSSSSSSSSISDWGSSADASTATKKKSLQTWIFVGVAAVLLIVFIWYMIIEFPDKTQKKPPPQAKDARDQSLRTYSLVWSTDPIDPKPVITVSPPFDSSLVTLHRSLDGIRELNVQPLFSFEPNLTGVQCALSATNLNKSIHLSIVRPQIEQLNAGSIVEVIAPDGMHSPALTRIAMTPRWPMAGIDQNTLMQVALWLTPHGLMIGDPKLDTKVTAGRFSSPEVQAVYPELTPVNLMTTPGRGSKYTTPNDLLHPSALPTAMQDRPVHFRTAPFAVWTIAKGRLGTSSDNQWPFAPTLLGTKVVWSSGTTTDHGSRWIEFLENGELRIVDRDIDTGDIKTVLWTASADVRTSLQTGSGCV